MKALPGSLGGNTPWWLEPYEGRRTCPICRRRFTHRVLGCIPLDVLQRLDERGYVITCQPIGKSPEIGHLCEACCRRVRGKRRKI